MNIQILSDLHLETQPHFNAEPVAGVDVLVLAGDIGSYQKGSRLQQQDGQRDFGLSRFAAMSAGGRWPKVIYLPGNHEYDGGDFDAIHQELRAMAQSLGMVWLERETHVIGDVRFIGTTLWSDFDALTGLGNPSPIEQLKRRNKAFRAADFYLRKTDTTRDGQPFLAPQVRELALECQAWLADALAVPFKGTTVVVTHFAPSLRSVDPRYGLTPGTAGFCNALDHLLAGADIWIHGHLHCLQDYVVDTGTRRCRVVANPLGYEKKGEQVHYRPGLTIRCGAPT